MCQFPPDSHSASRFQVRSVAALALDIDEVTGAATANAVTARATYLRQERVDE
jgi:hypothetical protein